MTKKTNSLFFFKEEQIRCENFLKKHGVYEKTSNTIPSGSIKCYKNLVRIYFLISDYESVKKMVFLLSHYGYCIKKDRWDVQGLREEDKNNPEILAMIGSSEVENAVLLSLGQINPARMHQLFQWAIENCTLPHDYLTDKIEAGYHNFVAVPHLWRSYALISLGKYSEALPFLTQVEPLFKEWKRTGGEIYEKVEFALPKALIPLCEFKLKPTRQNLINAQNGIEEYIKSLRVPKDKLDGYLYYFHLKDQFADVYSADPKDYPEQVPGPVKESVKEIPASESAEPQNVWIWDIVSATSGEEFGTDEELKNYVQNIKLQGEFPVLSNLYDIYLQWDEVDATELAEETGRLLKMKDLDPEIRKKTEIIREIAEYSAAKGCGRLVLKPDEGE